MCLGSIIFNEWESVKSMKYTSICKIVYNENNPLQKGIFLKMPSFIDRVTDGDMSHNILEYITKWRLEFWGGL
jgi:hypothetical protein